EALQADCEGRGIELVEVASGWRYQVRADVHPWVARLWTERQTRYTRATLETLALIAYRQPITRGEIEQVRGVATSSNIIKALEEREWIRVVGHRDVPGRPELLGTTKAFLDYFGLKRLDELPPLSELKDFAELEPQLEFEGERAVGGIAGADADPSGDGATEESTAGDAPSGTGSDGSAPGPGTDIDAGLDTRTGSDADADAGHRAAHDDRPGPGRSPPRPRDGHRPWPRSPARRGRGCRCRRPRRQRRRPRTGPIPARERRGRHGGISRDRRRWSRDLPPRRCRRHVPPRRSGRAR